MKEECIECDIITLVKGTKKKPSFICHYGIIDTYIQIFQKTRTSEFGKQLFKTTLYSHISYQSRQI